MEYPLPSGASTVAVAEAKATFGECLRRAERGASVVVTRHGTKVAAIVSVDDYERLMRLKAAGPPGGLASVAGGWRDTDDLVDAILGVRRTRSRRSRRMDR
ncbi:MAG: type II toxin-antitoxin system Phd/YefM family antitoxin [Acidobacteriota bacterium]